MNIRSIALSLSAALLLICQAVDGVRGEQREPKHARIGRVPKVTCVEVHKGVAGGTARPLI
jgi:hypothetical protein